MYIVLLLYIVLYTYYCLYIYRYIIYYMFYWALHLDRLLQKSLRYKHLKGNYIRSLYKEIVPVGLHLNKKNSICAGFGDF